MESAGANVVGIRLTQSLENLSGTGLIFGLDVAAAHGASPVIL
jgi:hypothetical protein